MPKLMYVGTCPECRMPLHRSRRRGFKERVLFRLLLLRPMRCHECTQRFFFPPTIVFNAAPQPGGGKKNHRHWRNH